MVYHLFGDFHLDDRKDHLNLTQLSRLKSLKSRLRNLEARSQKRKLKRHVIPNRIKIWQRKPFSSIFVIDLTNFVRLKLRYGIAHGQNTSSGELQSSIAHHLHSPSFNTNDVTGIETADETNACIWLLMQNGFKKNETLIFDHLTRREKSEEVDGIRDYRPEILECHENYVAELRSNMSATIEVVWGTPVRRRMMKMYRKRGRPLEEIRLWGSYEQVSLFLEWSEPLDSAGGMAELVRVIVFVMN